MAVVANQAVRFDKSMLTACPHLGDVLRPGLILDHAVSGSWRARWAMIHKSSFSLPTQVVNDKGR